MAETPTSIVLQKEQGYTGMGLVSVGTESPMSKQIKMLQAAFSVLAEQKVPRGSWLRAAVFESVHECSGAW